MTVAEILESDIWGETLLSRRLDLSDKIEDGGELGAAEKDEIKDALVGLASQIRKGDAAQLWIARAIESL